MNALFSPRGLAAVAITAESTVGALVEIRFSGSPVLQDVAAFEAVLRGVVGQIIKRQKTRRAILCTDLRGCGLLAPDVSERVIRLMKHDSPHIERNAFLLGSTSAILNLQVQRAIAASRGGARRTFTEEVSLQSWLAEVTNPAEHARLQLFLGSIPLIN